MRQFLAVTLGIAFALGVVATPARAAKPLTGVGGVIMGMSRTALEAAGFEKYVAPDVSNLPPALQKIVLGVHVNPCPVGAYEYIHSAKGAGAASEVSRGAADPNDRTVMVFLYGRNRPAYIDVCVLDNKVQKIVIEWMMGNYAFDSLTSMMDAGESLLETLRHDFGIPMREVGTLSWVGQDSAGRWVTLRYRAEDDEVRLKIFTQTVANIERDNPSNELH